MEERPTVPICQSCGMPLQSEEEHGNEKDGTKNQEYCKFCYQDGEFTNPDTTVDEQIEHVTKISQDKTNIPEEDARELARTLIPELKRWKKE